MEINRRSFLLGAGLLGAGLVAGAKVENFKNSLSNEADISRLGMYEMSDEILTGDCKLIVDSHIARLTTAEYIATGSMISRHKADAEYKTDMYFLYGIDKRPPSILGSRDITFYRSEHNGVVEYIMSFYVDGNGFPVSKTKADKQIIPNDRLKELVNTVLNKPDELAPVKESKGYLIYHPAVINSSQPHRVLIARANGYFEVASVKTI